MSLETDDVVALYERHSDELLGFLAHRTGDRQLARDLLGDTFVSALAARAHCRADDQAQRVAWLYRIAANKLYEHSRRRRSERRALWRLGNQQSAGASEPGYERVEQLLAASELRPELEIALARLSEEQAQAIRSRVVEEHDYADVADELGVGEDAARARVSRGLRVLRRAIGSSTAVGLAILIAIGLTGGRAPTEAPHRAPAAPAVVPPQASPMLAPSQSAAPWRSAGAARAARVPWAAHRRHCGAAGVAGHARAHRGCASRRVSARRR